VILSAALVTACDSDTGSEPTSSPITESTATTAAPVSWPTEEATIELAFVSGDFELVGDLVLPGGEGPYPAVIAVHGSGAATRRAIPGYGELHTRLMNAGFALFSWDKPGSGESTGQITLPITERSQILADAIAFLADRPEIDASRIGLWGLSQAGWVMPKALELTDDVAFMIVVSGGAEDSIEQTTYRIGRQLVCMGATEEEGRIVEEDGARVFKADTYEEYRTAAELVHAIPGVHEIYPFEIADEADWSPASPELDIESYFDPMEVVRDLTIPVFAVFGDLDKNIDPIQGADAYAAVFADGGHELSAVELIPGVGHTMRAQQTGCIGDQGGVTSLRYLELLDEWISLLATEL
jgi:pimeloyl-ACP methyl ester carboxylesterase